MKDNRRSFFKKSATLAASIPFAGIAGPLTLKTINNKVINLAKDAGMEASEAYFSGMNEQKINLLKQMDVFGAVGGINTKMVAMENAKAFEEKPVMATKEAWKKAGLNFNVVEGPPSLGEN